MTSPAPIKLDRARIEPIKVRFRFLTWVFGGGVKHNEDSAENRGKPARPFDEVTPVRSSSIRGQLRFWWRATTGARLGSLEELKRREAKVWGGIWSGEASPAKVGLAIDARDGFRPAAVPVFDTRNFPRATNQAEGLEYGAFPFRPRNAGSGVAADAYTALWDYGDHEATLLLTTSPEFVDEVTLAVSAWLAFGGYGARTTRGFGAVALAEGTEPREVTDSPEGVFGRLKKLAGARLNGVPALPADPSRIAFGNAKSDPHEGWTSSLGSLQKFRQGLDLGRNSPSPGSKSPVGRSRWPEPDELRAITGDSEPRHSERWNLGAAFPRADFGLPIIFHFHFKDPEDPSDQRLQPDEKKDRLPSPVLLRPTSDNRPMAVWLENADAPENLFVKGAKSNVGVKKSVSPQNLARLTPEQKTLVDPSPIAAFLKQFP